MISPVISGRSTHVSMGSQGSAFFKDSGFEDAKIKTHPLCRATLRDHLTPREGERPLEWLSVMGFMVFMITPRRP
jgi:hypothetical protein